MKGLRRLLLILLIVLGHTHVCHAIWRLPSGQVCAACPQTEYQGDRHEEGERPVVKASSGDCRDCCSLTHCNDDEPDAVKAFSMPPALVMARIEPALVLPTPVEITHDPVSAIVALHQPNAPPAHLSARAPPSPLA